MGSGLQKTVSVPSLNVTNKFSSGITDLSSKIGDSISSKPIPVLIAEEIRPKTERLHLQTQMINLNKQLNNFQHGATHLEVNDLERDYAAEKLLYKQSK